MPATIAMLAALSNAHLFWPPTTYEIFSPTSMHDYWHDLYIARTELASSRQASPYWTATADAYQMKMHLPDLEPRSVSAALTSDGKQIEIHAERKIEGCTCKSTTVKQINLPYRPRAEDVEVTMKDDVLLLKLARHAKAGAPTPLKVNVLEAPKDKGDEPAPSSTRPLRFVPHASAAEPAAEAKTLDAKTLDEKERSLTDKFRSAALASLAASRTADSTEATTTEGAGYKPGTTDAPANLSKTAPSTGTHDAA